LRKVQKEGSKQRVDLNKITPFDIVLIAFILLLTAGIILRTKLNFGWPSSNAKTASFYHDGKLHDRLPLDEDREIVLLNGKMRVEIKENRIRVKQSECPRRVCVNVGWIRHTGEAIVCVPFKTLIAIESAAAPVVDAVVF
jgi:hypothetical protein